MSRVYNLLHVMLVMFVVNPIACSGTLRKRLRPAMAATHQQETSCGERASMTRTDPTTTSQGGAHHTRLGPDWYLSNSVESGCAPLVERRRFGRALMRAIKGVNEHLLARRRSLAGRDP
jgi:hypothetical protein